MAAAQRSDLVRLVMRAIATTAGEGKSDTETREAIVQAVGISPERLSSQDVSWLYRAVVAGLIATMGLALIALAWTILDGNDKTSPDLLLTAFTGTLGGLIGLFVRAPTQ